MREVLLRLREPCEDSPNPQFMATKGRAYEDEGETFDPSAATDFAVHTHPGTYIYRPWYPHTVQELHIAGLLVDVESVARRQEGGVTIVERSEGVEPLVVGKEAVIAGVSLGVIQRIVERSDYMPIERTGGILSDTDVQRFLGLRFDQSFFNADMTLSAVYGKPTNVYKFTAERVQEYLRDRKLALALPANDNQCCA